MPPSNKDRLQNRIRIRKTTPSRVSRPAPGSLAPREARSTFDIHKMDSPKEGERPPRRPSPIIKPEPAPYYGATERNLPTEKERWKAAHVSLKQRQSAAASDIARGKEPPPRDVKPRLTKEKYAARLTRKAAERARTERIARVDATGRPSGRKGRVPERPAGRIEGTSPPKDSPKGAKAFKTIVSSKGLGRASTPEKISKQTWHGKYGATPPFGGRYPNQPSTVARVPKVTPKPKPSWGGRTGGALSVFGEPIAYGIAGGIKSRSAKGVLTGLNAWKEKYLPSNPAKMTF